MKLKLIFLTALVFIWTGLVYAAPTDPLEAGFLNPPDSAKPQTWWHWMNGNITKEGITADLEAMKQIGLGGATIVNVDSGIPRGPVPFMSPEWRDDFKFTVQEANRLGLELCVENCAGWSSSGGPWNTPEHAMQHVVTTETRVSGPANFNGVLRQPLTMLGFYRDIAVLAFPAPAGETVGMKDFAPAAITSVPEQPSSALTDGNTQTIVSLPVPAPDEPTYAQIQFPQPFLARSVKITAGYAMPESSGVIQVSDDGKTFRTLRPFGFGRRSSNVRVISLGAEAVASRYWRVQFNSAASNATQLPLAEIELSPKLVIENFDAKDGNNGAAVLADNDAGTNPAEAIPRKNIIDLTSKMDANGDLSWQVPAGDWIILRVGYTPTGRNNHPAPKEGEGLECDKFSKEALDLHWDGFMQKILDDIGPLGGKTLDASLIDSYEVGGQNWTANFREEFLKRRGYDLTPFFPAFTGRVVDNPEITERFLWDVRKTIADLFAENYFGHFAELCRQHGLMNAVEPYTGPFESLQCGAAADIVMGEFWSGTQGHRSVKIAASVAHTYGKTIVGAESFTAQPAVGRWQNDPYSLKALGDLMYCQGLNRYIFHRYAMQPWTNVWPGMTMGQWGFHFERTVTWWQQGKAWIDYITHCQFLLQQGHPVADVAYFCGESVPVEIRVGNPPTPPGYDYDAINADVLLHRTTVKNGRITLPDGVSYAVLILPPDDPNMTPALLERLHELARQGATIFGAPPHNAPGLANFPRSDKRVKKLTAELWGDCNGNTVTENAVGKGQVIWGQLLATVFTLQGLKPDFDYNSDSPATHLAYAHRVTTNADIYFVSNQRTQDVSADCVFRVSGKAPELWHPDTGVIEPAPVWRVENGRTIVSLSFEPAGSVFVVFREPAAGDHAITAKIDTQWQANVGNNGQLLVNATGNGTAEFRTTSGKTLRAIAADVPAPLEVMGPWTLSFPPNWGAPASVQLDNLISWTDHPNDGVRYFSGTATYEKDIEIPADRLAANRELWLDLGKVKNFAEVSVNGQSFGVLWKPPFRVNIAPAAKPGANKLVVKVTNLWPNRLIGDEQLPDDREWNGKQLAAWPDWFLQGKPSPTGRFTFTTWHHWTKNDAPLESGLLGPVRLRTVEIIPAD